MNRLHQSHIMVVGGSSGIGRAAVLLALDAGARVTVIARSRVRLDALLAARPDGTLAVHAADINDPLAVQQVFRSVAPVSHMLVTAGSFVGGGFQDAGVDPADAIDRALLRITGAVHVVRAAAKSMSAGGSIVLTGGVSTSRPVAGAWATAVGTAAAEQLARALALELKPIRVNAISPGWTDTPMWDSVLGASKLAKFESVASSIPTGAIATPGEVAEAALFLMNNPSVNGEVLHVDGGQRLV